MRFLDIDNNKIPLEFNSYLATIETITDKKTVKYEKMFFVVRDDYYDSKRYQINENTYNMLSDIGLEFDYNTKFPFYQISDIQQNLYEYNISSSIILKTKLVEDESKNIYFLGDLRNKSEIEISSYCADELQKRFNIEILFDEEEYQKRF